MSFITRIKDLATEPVIIKLWMVVVALCLIIIAFSIMAIIGVIAYTTGN